MSEPKEWDFIAMAKTVSENYDIGYVHGQGFTELSQDRKIIKGLLDKYRTLQKENERLRTHCKCGGIMFADTEDWPCPLCYNCYLFVKEKFETTQKDDEG